MQQQPFSNETLSISDLPKFETVSLQPLQKKYFKVIAFNILVFTVLVFTGISVAYVASDDLTLTSTFFNAESDKILVPNFKNYNVPVNSPEVLRLSSNNSDKITRHTFGREKGKQFCYFSRCKESPALLRLILDFKKIDEYKIKKFPKGKLLLFVKVKSQSDTYYFRSLIKFKE